MLDDSGVRGRRLTALSHNKTHSPMGETASGRVVQDEKGICDMI